MQESEAEIHEWRSRLEGITGSRGTAIAYPNGVPGRDCQRAHVDLLAKLGFECAVTTSWGCGTSSADVSQLPRITIWGRSYAVYMARVLRAYWQNEAEYL